MITYNVLICAFVRNDNKLIVYVKYSDEHNKYAVKIMHPDGTKTITKETYSLSAALRDQAEWVGQFTDGFSSWKSIQ